MLSPAWQRWIADHYAPLSRGERLAAPRELPHPSSAGFERPRLAMPEGQSRDWAAPQSDGSRVHLHEYPTGELIAHRDTRDPSRGIFAGAAHLLVDTGVGRTLLRGGLMMAFLRGFGS